MTNAGLRARWQIELLFKLWKSHGRIDAWRSAQPWRILCEVYAKLLAMIVQHWVLLVGCWQQPNRSLVKAAQTVQGYALALLSALGKSPARVAEVLEEIHRSENTCIRVRPSQGRRRMRKARSGNSPPVSRFMPRSLPYSAGTPTSNHGMLFNHPLHTNPTVSRISKSYYETNLPHPVRCRVCPTAIPSRRFLYICQQALRQ